MRGQQVFLLALTGTTLSKHQYQHYCERNQEEFPRKSILLPNVSGGGQDQGMEPANKNYIITKQMKLDFQIVLMAKNENEAAYHADLKEIELWTEVDSNWKIIDVSKATNLTMIKSASQIEATPEAIKAPVIKIKSN